MNSQREQDSRTTTVLTAVLFTCTHICMHVNVGNSHPLPQPWNKDYHQGMQCWQHVSLCFVSACSQWHFVVVCLRNIQNWSVLLNLVKWHHMQVSCIITNVRFWHLFSTQNRLIFDQWKFWKSFSTASTECADSLSPVILSILTGKYRGLNLGLDVNTVFYFFWSKWIQSSSRHVKLCFLKNQTVKHLFSNHHSFLQFQQKCWKTVLSTWGIRNQFWTQDFMSSVQFYNLLPVCEKPERWAAKPWVEVVTQGTLRHQHRRCTQTH